MVRLLFQKDFQNADSSTESWANKALYKKRTKAQFAREEWNKLAFIWARLTRNALRGTPTQSVSVFKRFHVRMSGGFYGNWH
ncbi:hypothetical protein [Ardenticatena maritima]|uniref:hypothetical protein n=1 Tax=Ardenticatena maritima TaxID=872965 RepID=UPI001364D6BF|nr:hypothetical protein [Ardenticatena maritima]